jgi:hypothetical protein
VTAWLDVAAVLFVVAVTYVVARLASGAGL